MESTEIDVENKTMKIYFGGYWDGDKSWMEIAFADESDAKEWVSKDPMQGYAKGRFYVDKTLVFGADWILSLIHI